MKTPTNATVAGKTTFVKTIILILLPILTVGMGITGCKGPAGTEGAQGSQGPAGPIGPAGEDGSMIYAGNEAPSSDIGDIGDYYLNSNTGEFYGPKDSEGWGEPIIVLMGEDGQDGADGNDGSQIYSGDGPPDTSLGVEGDYYLDKTSYELYGPKTSSGWAMPLNLKGTDGNANVTRYLFSGHDFSSFGVYHARVPIENEEETRQSAWLVYLVGVPPRSISIEEAFWFVPGYGKDGLTYYRSDHYFVGTAPDGEVLFRIIVNSGGGEVYDRVEVVRIEASSTEDLTGIEDSPIPDHLDLSDYSAVAKHYGFGKSNEKMSVE